MPAPFDLVAAYSDGTTERFHQTPAVWQADPKKTSITIKTKKKIKSLSINGGIWMDADETNNEWTAR